MNSTPESELPGTEVSDPDAPVTQVPDPELIGGRDLALAALREITDEKTIGDAAGYREEPDGALSLRFANRMAGYPGWFWTVTLARVEGSAPTVLEAELMPGDGALLAPEWTPWAERLAEYHAHQAELDQEALAAQASGDESGDSDDDDAEDDSDDDLDDDIDDLDAADFDEDGSPILHSGDVDGVDIDNFSDDADSDDDEDDSDEDDSDDDDEDDSDDDDDSDEDDSDDDEDDSDDDESDDDDSDEDESDDDDDEDDELDYQDPRVDRSY
jgi:hypothetical protein